MLLTYEDIQQIEERLVSYPEQAQIDIWRLIAAVPKALIRKEGGYSDTFLRIFESYPKKESKAAAYRNYCQLLEEGHTEDALKRCVDLYVSDQRIKKTEPMYYLTLATFFGPDKRRFEDYIDEASQNPRDQPDWCESAGKLIRHMTAYERMLHRIPNQLPISMDYSRGFGTNG